ncbi:MAG: RagB/SusD family nutrient uptake outer membrane protein [Salinibacter sp.]|uniref:RagB/SusD family nutrient uptake outer membrane protein n=1 Tax=Salinibacter sp. TaxID=2065818 RepID=UPI0035D5212C
MRILVNTTIAIFLLTALAGCDTILNKPQPSTRVSQQTALTNPDAIRGVRNSMYDRFHGPGGPANSGTFMMVGPASLADNLVFRPGAGRFAGLNRFNEGAGLGTLIRDVMYGAINDANLLIKGIKEDALPSQTRKKFQAEGYFIRALSMHYLVRVFGYDPAGPNSGDGLVQPQSGPGSDWSKGIIIRTKPTLSPQDATEKARASVREVYNQIISDLKQAISLFSNLNSDVRTKTRYFASQAAAEAILARVQLYQRNWEAADTRAQNAIDLASSRFGSSLAEPSQLEAIFDETTGDNPEAIFEIETDPLAAVDAINDAPSVYTSLGFLAQVPTQELLNLYGSNDARLDHWYGKCIAEDEGENVVEDCMARNNKGFELQKYQTERGVADYADDYPITRIAEMYLIQAEARLHTTGPSAAIARLNDLRAKRNASMLDPVNYNMDSAMNEILAERRRELVAEGHRFFDLKRLGRDIPKDHVPNFPGTVVPFNDNRILDDFPAGAVEVNGPLTQNPGY